MNSRWLIYLVPMLMIATLTEAADNPPPKTKGAQPAPPAEQPSDVAISIHGNQEQPTVLYIVPWQDAGDNRPLQELSKPSLQQIFQQVERQEHQREIHYLTGADGGEKKEP